MCPEDSGTNGTWKALAAMPQVDSGADLSGIS